MNINEVEKLTGLAKANIRYYESQELLDPPRKENGYRDYSDEHVQLLKKIRLLRTLDMPIEEIRSVIRGETILTEELTRQLTRLQDKQEEAAESEAICRRMLQDGVNFALLEPERYLDASPAEPQKERIVLKLEQDREPPLSIPWQRYFARTFDMGICGLLWFAIASLGFRYRAYTPSTGNNVVNGIVGAVLMLLIEPFLLHFFGTTPGKWLLGMRIEGRHGRNPDLDCAFSRTAQVVFWGLGVGIPFFSIYRLYKSYKTEQEGESLPWEEETEILYRSRSWKGVLSYVFCTALVLLFAFGVFTEAELPLHRGDLTVAQLAENYQFYGRYFNVSRGFDPDENGLFFKSNNRDIVWSDTPIPQIDYEIEDGSVTGITFRCSTECKTYRLVYNYAPEHALLAYSYLLSQDDAGLFRAGVLRKEQDRVMNRIVQEPLGNWEEVLYGVHISQKTEYSGYVKTGDMLYLPDETDPTGSYCLLTFTMTKNH